MLLMRRVRGRGLVTQDIVFPLPSAACASALPVTTYAALAEFYNILRSSFQCSERIHNRLASFLHIVHGVGMTYNLDSNPQANLKELTCTSFMPLPNSNRRRRRPDCHHNNPAEAEAHHTLVGTRTTGPGEDREGVHNQGRPTRS